MRPVLAALLTMALAFPAGASDALILDHDMLTSMARTGAPGVTITYTPTRVVFGTRFRAAVVWLDVRAEAAFVREDKRLRLALQHLSAAGINQNGSRFFEASAKLAKLVDVETPSSRVEIYHAGKLVYAQEIK